VRFPVPGGLRGRFLLLLLVLYLTTAGGAVAIFASALDRLVNSLGRQWLAQQAEREQLRITAPVQREVALVQAMMASPAIRGWLADEQNDIKRQTAFGEIENFRRAFHDHEVSLVVEQSLNYYFSDDKQGSGIPEVSYALERHSDRDDWYFEATANPEPFWLNIDFDAPLKITRLWVNVVARDGSRVLGLGSSALDLSEFLDEVRRGGGNATNLLFDSDGFIKAHPESRYAPRVRADGDVEQTRLYDLLADDAQRARLRQALAEHRGPGTPPVLIDLQFHDGPRLVAAMPLPQLGWNLLVVADLDRLLGVTPFLPFAALLLAALFALSVAMIWLINRLVLARLITLSRAAQAVAEGDYGVRSGLTGGDELASLARTFDQMAATVQQHTTGLETLVASRTRALEESHDALREANGKLLDSIEYARLIQHAVLPDPAELRRHLSDHAVIWRPRDLVGGDFYYFHATPEGSLLALGDCTGHGVPGALMHMAATATLDQVVREGVLAPAEVLREVHRRMQRALHQGEISGHTIASGLDLAVCCWRPGAGPLHFAGAGIGLLHSGGGELTYHKGSRQGLAYRRSTLPDVDAAIAIDPVSDSRFFLATDGVLDQAGGEKGYGFGLSRLQQVLRDNAALPLDRQVEAVAAAVAEWQGTRPQRDDMSFIAFTTGAPAEAGPEQEPL